MKKKLISFILIFSMILTSALYLVACDGREEQTGGDTPSETESVKETEKSTESGDKETNKQTESEEPSQTETQTSDESNTSETVTETSSETEGVSESESASEPTSEPTSESASSSESASETTSETVSETESAAYEETECEHPYATSPEGHWKPACSVCGKKEGKVQDHEYEEKVEDEGDLLLYSFRCTVCKYRAYKQEVPYAINLFFSAGELSSRADVSAGTEQSFGFDSGVGYGSFGVAAGGSSTITIMSGGDATVPTGKYLVMKVRLPKSKNMFSISVKSVSASAAQSVSFSSIPAGWVTLVVDLTTAVKTVNGTDATTGEPTTTSNGYAPDASGDYYLSDFKITAAMGAGENFNVAYALLCDKLEDAKAFIDSEKIVITYEDALSGSGVTDKKECVDENGNPIEHKYVINDDGTHTLLETCYQCGLAAVENEPHTYSQIQVEGADGKMEYTVACSACKHQKFSANVNQYLDAYSIFNIAPNYFRNTKIGVLTDSEGKFDYASFSGQGNTAQIIFARNMKEASDAEKAVTMAVGSAKYFIVRLRTNKPDMNHTYTFATTSAELEHGIHNGVDKGWFPKVAAFKIPLQLAESDEWTTFVVDLSKLIPNSWVADENGNRTICTFYCNIGSTDYTPDVKMEFEYMAFVDSWDEVEAVVSDETVVNVSSSGNGNIVKTEGMACIGQHSGVVNEVDGVLRVECSACGTLIKEIKVPEGINYYSDLGTMDKMGNSLTKFQYDEKADVLYNRYEGSTGCHLNVAGGANGGVYTEATYQTGNYIVLKYRLQGTASLEIATSDFGTAPNLNPPRPLYTSIGTRVCTGGLSDWTVALIAIPDGKNYTKNSEQQLGLRLTTSGGDYIFDISYIAIVDSVDEAKLLLEEGETLVEYGDKWDGTDTPGESGEEETPPTDRELTTTVFGPDVLVTPPENTTGTFKLEKLSEDGVDFVRISDMTVNGDGWAAINYLNASHTAKARYVAIKVRLGENGLGQNYLKLYTGTTGSLVSEGQGISFKVAEDGKWAVVVIDILNRIKDKATFMTQNKDGSYTVKYFAIRPFSNTQSGGVQVDDTSADPDAKYMYKYTNTSGKTRWSATELTPEQMTEKGYATFEGIYKMSVQPEMYMDIAYIAFFEDMSQLKEVVPDEIYQWSVDSATNAPLKTADGKCVVCTPVESANGSTYSYKCSFCGNDFATKTVSDGVKAYYSAGHIAKSGSGALDAGPQHYRLDGITVDGNGAGASLVSDGDTVATRIYGNGMGQTAQLIWQKTNDDGKHNGTAEQKYTRDVGQAKYLVIRVKSNDAERSISVNISSEGANGTANILFDVAVEGADKWLTYVIDLSAVAKSTSGDLWAKKVTTTDADGEGGEDPVTETAENYAIDTFFINFQNFAATQYVDFEFIAFAETWADVDALTSDEYAYNVKNLQGDLEKVSVADGSKIE
ncbi:MAG: hypothetical protein J6L83_07380 [Clostridia bacterium]|nr:hypothetical protein [Clostridia bacterium]